MDAFFFLEKRGKGKTGKKNNRIDVIPQLTIIKLKFINYIYLKNMSLLEDNLKKQKLKKKIFLNNNKKKYLI